LAGDGIDFTVGTPAGNETLTISGETGTAINAGILELATNAETVTGTDTERATTPANITAKMAAPGAIGETTPNSIKLSNSGLKVLDTNASHVVTIKPGSDITADRILTITTGDAARTITLSGNPTLSDWFNQELKTTSSPEFVDEVIGSAYLLNNTLAGYVTRPQFRWMDVVRIYIGEGAYSHNGTADQVVYWDSELTFTLESGGSNGDSDDYGADGWHYIYIDDSAVVTNASPLLDNTCFLNLTGANADPVWNGAKRAWVGDGVGTATSSDRCIFAVYETGGGISYFSHDGGSLVTMVGETEDYASADPGTDFAAEVTLTIPAFSRKALCRFQLTFVDGAPGYGYWRNTASAGAGHIIGTVEAGSTRSNVITDVLCNSALKIDIKVSAASDTMIVNTSGWHLPNGM